MTTPDFSASPSAQHQPIRLVHRGALRALENVPPDKTLLEVLREDLHLCGTKEGCNEGDCGACTVVLGELDPSQPGGVRFQSVNSCIRLAHSAQGRALWTVEDLSTDPLLVRTEAAQTTAAQPPLHPAQQAVLDCHGSQCGFCTPGFVMSLFNSYQNRVCPGGGKAQPVPMTREQAQQDLSGNLCRCTGYRPLLDAAERMASLPPVRVDAAPLRRLLKEAEGSPTTPTMASARRGSAASYLAPTTLEALLRARQEYPSAQVVAGCTDVGLWINKGHQRYTQVLDVTRAAELRAVERYPHHVAIGAAVNLEDAYAALVAERPQLAEFAHRFAGLPVRHSGTLGGNIANGSPIGDSMPLLLALGASLVLMRWNPRGKAGQKVAWRELALEDFYTGYRQNVLRPDELLAWVKVPRPTRHETLRVYKVSKRFDDDISAVCLALNLQVQAGVVRAARIGAGGVAATPARARQTEAALLGQPWTEATALAAAAALQAEFQPISDMRASAAYRSTLLGALVQRFWLETAGPGGTDHSGVAPLRLNGLQMLEVAP